MIDVILLYLPQGRGHKERTLWIKEALVKEGVSSLHLPYSPFFSSLKTKVLVADIRDFSLPKGISFSYAICIDNQGKGREEAQFVWDAMPHFRRSPRENLLTLEKIRLSPKLLEKYPPAFYKAKISNGLG